MDERSTSTIKSKKQKDREKEEYNRVGILFDCIVFSDSNCMDRVGGCGDTSSQCQQWKGIEQQNNSKNRKQNSQQPTAGTTVERFGGKGRKDGKEGGTRIRLETRRWLVDEGIERSRDREIDDRLTGEWGD